MTDAEKELREWCESALVPPGKASMHEDGSCTNCNLHFTARALLAVLDTDRGIVYEAGHGPVVRGFRLNQITAAVQAVRGEKA